MNSLKLNIKLILFFLLISLSIYSQQSSPFRIGFDKGFEDTCKGQGFVGNMGYSGDYLKCDTGTNMHTTNAEQFSAGYRCGTIQATEYLEKIKKNNNEDLTKIRISEREPVNEYKVGTPDHLNVDIYKELQDKDYNYRKPIDYGHPISLDIFNNDITIPQKYYYNPYEYKRVFIEDKTNSLIKKDEKIEKEKKEIRLNETKINKRLIEKNKNYQINELTENGWYECFIEFNRFCNGKKYETLENKFVYIENSEIKYWIGQYDMIFKVAYFFKKSNNTFDLMLDMTKDINDKQVMTKNIYFTSNTKYPITPFFTSPNILNVFTKRNFKGNGILFSIKNIGETEKTVNFINNKWTKNQAPNYWDYENVAKFTLPKGKYHYFAYSEDEFWEGEITIENPYTKIELK
jgi:hypothetical protein